MRYLSLLTVCCVAVSVNLAHAQEAKERSEIDDQYKWDLTAMYPSAEAWEADFDKLEAEIPDAAQFKGRLGESGEVLLAAINRQLEMSSLFEDIFVYAGLKAYEDQRVSENAAMFSRANSANSELSEAWAFFQPEFLTIPPETLERMIESTEGLQMYRHYLDQLGRMRPYTLSEPEERILALAIDPLSKFNSVFSSLDNADLTFGTIKDESGQEVELTKARFNTFRESPDRRVRMDAMKGLFSEYEEFGNTLASNYEGHVKAHVFVAQARGYDSAMQASLYPNAIPVEVYTNLIKTAREHAAPLQRYMEIRRELLGVDTLQMWDLYAPIVKPVWKNVPFEDAKKLVAEGLAPLGKEYIDLYWFGFQDGWVDAFENRGKRGGAYSWGTYTSKPYLSMNYEGTLNDVFTLAHEYGHSLHSYMTHESQPYVYGNYRIFIAEVASMTNEAILVQNMLRKASSRDEKLALLQHYLEDFRTAFYRQISFADFEMQAHAAVENGEALTKESLNQMYADVFKAYYGDAVQANPLNSAEWSRIPHFLRTDNFYVYQYATSFAAATALAKNILDNGQPAVDRFMELLHAGDSDYPIELLKRAGVDMTTPQPILDTVAVFEQLLDELEATLASDDIH